MTEIAGLGSRSYAFIVDWHIRILLALIWVLAALLALHQGLNLQPRSVWVIWVPAAAIYLLYHPVIETVLRGQSPGKRTAGVRVASRGGGTPSHGAVVIRNVLRLIDSLPLFYVVGIVSCAVSKDRVRIGDIVAGTVLVQADAPDADEPGELSLINELLERWPSLEPRRRGEIARSLLVRLGQDVGPAPAAAADDRELRERLRVAAGQRAGSESTRRAKSPPSWRSFKS